MHEGHNMDGQDKASRYSSWLGILLILAVVLIIIELVLEVNINYKNGIIWWRLNKFQPLRGPFTYGVVQEHLLCIFNGGRVQQHLVYLVWIIIFFSGKQFYYDINKTWSKGSATTCASTTTWIGEIIAVIDLILIFIWKFTLQIYFS